LEGVNVGVGLKRGDGVGVSVCVNVSVSVRVAVSVLVVVEVGNCEKGLSPLSGFSIPFGGNGVIVTVGAIVAVSDGEQEIKKTKRMPGNTRFILRTPILLPSL
jgi:hypothetical protein